MSREPMRRILELDFPAEPQVIHQIRESFASFVEPCSLGPDEVQALKVALSEAASNAVCHGSPAGPRNRVHLRFEMEPEQLVVEVSDEGRGFRPGQITLPDEAEWKPSGRGLFLMQALMDAVHFERTPAGTRVRLVKHLNHSGGGCGTLIPAVLDGMRGRPPKRASGS